MARSRFQPAVAAQLGDEVAERVRRNHEQRISEVTSVPIVGGRLLRNVFLTDNIPTAVPHGLGRPAIAIVSPPRRNGTGLTAPFVVRVDGSSDATDSTPDPSKFITLHAGGWGGTGVFVDIWVF